MENRKYIVDSPVGCLTIVENLGNIIEISFGKSPTCGIIGSNKTIEAAVSQLDEYFAGKRHDFNLPLAPNGTEFQRRVWGALETIPYGQTVSYKYIAEKIGCPKGSRAVGMANHNNPISIVIPCHRVIGASGKLVGYGGGLDIKAKLLSIEGIKPLL